MLREVGYLESSERMGEGKKKILQMMQSCDAKLLRSPQAGRFPLKVTWGYSIKPLGKRRLSHPVLFSSRRKGFSVLTR